MKTILLDFDGVMVKNQPWKKIELHEDGFYNFDESAIQNLKWIIQETNCDITLTTSHKTKYTNKEWCDIFKKRGINTNIKQVEEKENRKEEILNWIKYNKSLNYVILDDDKTLNELNEIKDKFILIESGLGLTNEKAKETIKILKR